MKQNSSVPSERVESPTLSAGHHGSSPKCLPHGLRNKLVKGVSNLKPAKQSSGKKEKSKLSPKPSRAFGCGGGRDNREEGEGEERTRRSNESVRVRVLRTGEELPDSSIRQPKIGNASMKPEQGHSKSRSGTSSKVDMSTRQLPSPPSYAGAGSSIPKPTAAVKGTSKASKEVPNPAKQMHRMGGHPTGGISVALVSPMPTENLGHHFNLVRQTNRPVAYPTRPDSAGNDPSKSAVRKIETTFDNLDKVITCEAQQMRPRETTFGEDDGVMNVKPMQPLSRGYGRGFNLTGSNIMSSMAIAHAGFHDRSRKYANNSKQVELTADVKRGVGDGGYGDAESDLEMISGYLSDGDMLRGGASHTLADMCDGYMSEGGGPLFMQRLHAQQVFHGMRYRNNAAFA